MNTIKFGLVLIKFDVQFDRVDVCEGQTQGRLAEVGGDRGGLAMQ
jgi:hypothetical protein